MPSMKLLKYAFTDNSDDLNSNWWNEMKTMMRKFIQLIYNLLDEG
jgi:hypothetical protein